VRQVLHYPGRRPGCLAGTRLCPVASGGVSPPFLLAQTTTNPGMIGHDPRRGVRPMTEAEWLACGDPDPMLRLLAGKVSDRKLRLFACACCRRIWDLVVEEHSCQAVRISELYADGGATFKELEAAFLAVERASDTLRHGGLQTQDAFDAARLAAHPE